MTKDRDIKDDKALSLGPLVINSNNPWQWSFLFNQTADTANNRAAAVTSNVDNID